MALLFYSFSLKSMGKRVCNVIEIRDLAMEEVDTAPLPGRHDRVLLFPVKVPELRSKTASL